MLRYLPQLVSYKTGMDVRIGYPNEFLSSDVISEINQPMYATSVGLVLRGLEVISNGKKLDYKEPELKKTEPEKPLQIVKEEEEKPKKKKTGFGFFDRFINMSDNIFDKDEDSKM
jgi:cell division protein FtsA